MAAVDSCEKLQINFIVILCVQEYNALRFLIVFCSYVRFHKFYEKHLEVIVKNTIRIFCLILQAAASGETHRAPPSPSLRRPLQPRRLLRLRWQPRLRLPLRLQHPHRLLLRRRHQLPLRLLRPLRHRLLLRRLRPLRRRLHPTSPSSPRARRMRKFPSVESASLWQSMRTPGGLNGTS